MPFPYPDPRYTYLRYWARRDREWGCWILRSEDLAAVLPLLELERHPRHIVPCEIEEIELENDDGKLVPSVSATCTRCQHEVASYGTHERSIARCLALMRKECPEEQNNYYVDADDEN